MAKARFLPRTNVESVIIERQMNSQLDILKAKIDEGLDEARRGELVDGERFMARVKKRIEEAAAARPRTRPKKRRK
ncbi:MAG: hypothetical protein B6D36_10225 [Planctomycetes bacterium UTPLA1]|nr:MAG: hypothetical protein B6D36_10225 [Planctomycetes bacterium UTPLA1]